MTILAIESTGQVGSYSLVNETKVLGVISVNHTLKHGETQMPLIDMLIKALDFNLEDIDALAVTVGPGSFTGIRIGIATAKGLAFGLNKKIIPVSSLAALAYNIPRASVVVPIMDARRDQVYGAIYDTRGAIPLCLMEERALAVDELIRQVNGYNETAVFVGDGIITYESKIKIQGHFMAPLHLNQINAAGVGGLALKQLDKIVEIQDLQANYIRPSQAERERSHMVE